MPGEINLSISKVVKFLSSEFGYLDDIIPFYFIPLFGVLYVNIVCYYLIVLPT